MSWVFGGKLRVMKECFKIGGLYEVIVKLILLIIYVVFIFFIKKNDFLKVKERLMWLKVK